LLATLCITLLSEYFAIFKLHILAPNKHQTPPPHYSGADNCREFTAASSNPSGDTIVLGNYNALYTFAKNKESMAGWEHKGILNVENMYSVTAMDWRPDGDKLVVGTLCGVVDVYDVCMKRSMYKGGFELTYVSHSQVIVKKLENNMRIVVKSQFGREILKTNIYKNRYVVAKTADTLLIGDFESLRLSEFPWRGGGNEKYIFENPNACIIYFAGEASVIEFGEDEPLGSVRTAFTSSHVLSLRINERKAKASADGYAPTSKDNKKMAFLLDAQTINIKDFVSQSSITISHDCKVDFLELNSRADMLLFRDKRRHLHLYEIATQTRTQLLDFCTYVQWVPNSDVLVAQSRSNLCVWYNIHAPDQITIQAIKGDVEDIERYVNEEKKTATEVIVDEGIQQAVYPLNESLISFGTAIDDQDFIHSCAIASGDTRISQRCAAAVVDMASCKFLGEIKDIEIKAEEDAGIKGSDHYLSRCKNALLKKDLKGAEIELLNQGKVDECIDMYQRIFKHDEVGTLYTTI
jgi:intraflagellar transport protein 172